MVTEDMQTVGVTEEDARGRVRWRRPLKANIDDMHTRLYMSHTWSYLLVYDCKTWDKKDICLFNIFKTSNSNINVSFLKANQNYIYRCTAVFSCPQSVIMLLLIEMEIIEISFIILIKEIHVFQQ